MHGLHVAVVDNLGEVDIERVRAYLPGNYTASQVGSVIVVEGRDYAGWTYDEYVQPRLATGAIFLREVTPKHKTDDQSWVNIVSDIHSDLQGIFDRLGELPEDEDYPHTNEQITDACNGISWAMHDVETAIKYREEEYQQLLDRLEK